MGNFTAAMALANVFIVALIVLALKDHFSSIVIVLASFITTLLFVGVIVADLGADQPAIW